MLRSSVPKIPPAAVVTPAARRKKAALGLIGAGVERGNSDDSSDMPLAAPAATLGDFDEGTVSLDRICKHESYRRFYFDLLQSCSLQESSNCKSESFNTC